MAAKALDYIQSQRLEFLKGQSPITKGDINAITDDESQGAADLVTGIFPPKLFPAPIVPKIGDDTIALMQEWHDSSQADLEYAKGELGKSTSSHTTYYIVTDLL